MSPKQFTLLITVLVRGFAGVITMLSLMHNFRNPSPDRSISWGDSEAFTSMGDVQKELDEANYEARNMITPPR